MDNFISPKDFFEEMTKRPDVNEIMKRLAESGWDDPAVYLDTPYVTNVSDDNDSEQQRPNPQEQQPDEESGR